MQRIAKSVRLLIPGDGADASHRAIGLRITIRFLSRGATHRSIKRLLLIRSPLCGIGRHVAFVQ